ncbi:RT0821/Lpp0805 family surface protein [Methylobacterium sp. CB376]|uniref:RT0821/Lpp0805 family surface protein n=1 Tax=unclassified Methylobacterium TaxID=2615210 RepID=UPI000152D6D3|nr:MULTISPECIES: RT0821/Lpp0805 family surface protein [Methylobacterium]WFT82272.1 RT0821/Lpp0805 family surface protein [Methylobacterium nodulans]
MRRHVCKANSPATRRPAARLLRAALTGGLLVAGAGCSQPLLVFQAKPQAEAPAPEPTSTGSIGPVAPRSFGGDLTAEDWRRARAALAVALDPQGNGRPVKWDNPDSKMRGMVNPTGLPYVAQDEICRNFLATVIAPTGSRFVRGTGCRPSGGSWELKSLKATRAPA